MDNFLGFLKWLLIAVIFAAVAYVLYKVWTAAGSFGERLSAAWNGLKADVSSAASKVTPGWSSIVPLPSAMPPEMAAHYAQIKAAEPNLETENPNLPWYQKALTVHNFFGFDLAPTTSIKTPQTVGSSADQYNVPPTAISLLTPSNQPGQTPLGDTATTGSDQGTTFSNVGPVVGSLTQVRAYSVPPSANMPATTMDIYNPSPTPQASDINTDQLQFLGQ
jgi:hypothetical protein